MIKRQAKIEALNIATALINREIEESTGLTADYDPEDAKKVRGYLGWIVGDLEDKRDKAAYRQYLVDERKADNATFAKRQRAASRPTADGER
jgi:beta-lactamase class D